MTRADLRFNITEGLLTGSLDGEYFESRACSGGRGGSKEKDAEIYFLRNNPFSANVKGPDDLKKHPKDTRVGGTLPLGLYSLHTHHKKDHIRVDPLPGTNMHGRDAILIHGRGKRGSDGCIVPADFHVVQRLYAALAKREKKSAVGAPVLEVVAIGADVDRKLQQWHSMA
jgi:hypothetical protein